MIEEAKNMELLKQSLVTHLNISIHDAIIEQRQEDDIGIVSIVSPYASLGDLAQFLAGSRIYTMDKKFPRFKDSHQLSMSLLGQSKNLAEALEFLHNGFQTKANDWKIKCAHLDLKPSNILIFESSQNDEVVGNWKLCDFGISVFGAEHLHRGASPTVQLGSAGDFFMKLEKTIRTSPKRIPGVYQAPEIEHPHLTSGDDSNPELGARTSDIWSFGAIFAEVLAYARGGASGVKSFDQTRKCLTDVQGVKLQNDFFYTTISEDERRPSSILPFELRRQVSDWLERFVLDDQPRLVSSRACFRCWAECVKGIMEVDPRNRPSATTLNRWIADLRRHASDPSVPHVQFTGRTPGSPRAEPSDEDLGHISKPAEPRISATCNMKGERRVAELSLSSRDVIDYDLDGNNLVYLTRSSIDFFHVNSEDLRPTVEQLPNDHTWYGIKVADPYVVIWGRSYEPRSAVSFPSGPVIRVYFLTHTVASV